MNHCISVVRKDSGPAPATLEELRGKRIIVQRGDIMHDFILLNGLADRGSAVDSQGTALQELAEGRYDCALVARMTALYPALELTLRETITPRLLRDLADLARQQPDQVVDTGDN